MRSTNNTVGPLHLWTLRAYKYISVLKLDVLMLGSPHKRFYCKKHCGRQTITQWDPYLWTLRAYKYCPEIRCPDVSVST